MVLSVVSATIPIRRRVRRLATGYLPQRMERYPWPKSHRSTILMHRRIGSIRDPGKRHRHIS